MRFSSKETSNPAAYNLGNKKSETLLDEKSKSIITINRVPSLSSATNPSLAISRVHVAEKLKDPLIEDSKLRTKQLKKLRKQDIQKRFNDASNSTNAKSSNLGSKSTSDSYKTSCRMTFIFDPNGRFSYWMGKQNH